MRRPIKVCKVFKVKGQVIKSMEFIFLTKVVLNGICGGRNKLI